MKIQSIGSLSDLYKKDNIQDALPNLYEVKFPLLPNYAYGIAKNLNFDIENLAFRASTFTIPEDITNVEDIQFRGTTVSRAIGQFNTNNDITIELIVDGDWKAYKVFKAWKDMAGSSSVRYRQLSFDGQSNGGHVGRMMNRGQMSISTPIYSSDKNITWTFYEIQLIGIGELQFSYEGGNPMTLSLSFKYAYYEVK